MTVINYCLDHPKANTMAYQQFRNLSNGYNFLLVLNGVVAEVEVGEVPLSDRMGKVFQFFKAEIVGGQVRLSPTGQFSTFWAHFGTAEPHYRRNSEKYIAHTGVELRGV
jgi:hypothetical protein